MQEAKVVVDGCRKKSGDGGYAYMIYLENNIIFGGGFKSDTTNNIMELTAPMKALYRLSMTNVKDVVIESDSKYFVDGFNSWMHKWKKNGWNRGDKKVANLRIWINLYGLKKHFNSIKVEWVRGHNGHKDNELCDELANKCCAAKKNIDKTIENTGRGIGAHSISDFFVDDEPRFGKFTRFGESRDDSESFIKLDEESRVVIKDGRSLEEYLNHPVQIANRKAKGLANVDLVIVSRLFFEGKKITE